MVDIPVTVLMPVYNAELYLREAIESILNQTFTDFEFLIINDGSTDSSKDIIASYQDSRIRYVENESNLKLIATLNRGIELAKGTYIARMDADDISMPDRLEKLYTFMELHPEVGLCGSWFENFTEKGRGCIVKYATDDSTIRLKQLHQIHLSHGTCIFRTKVLTNNNLFFNPEFIHAEDYELWTRMAKYTKFANIPFMLYRVRNNGDSVSNKYTGIQNSNTRRIIINQFTYLKSDFNNDDFEIYCRFANAQFSWFDKPRLQQLDSLLTYLISKNKTIGYLPSQELEIYWSDKLFHICYNTKDGLDIWRKSLLYRKDILTFKKMMKRKIKLILMYKVFR